jgi:hypothetical protein
MQVILAYKRPALQQLSCSFPGTVDGLFCPQEDMAGRLVLESFFQQKF